VQQLYTHIFCFLEFFLYRHFLLKKLTKKNVNLICIYLAISVLSFRCKSEVYCQQPNKWLDYVLGLIQTDEARNKICETRRGGGIPFYVQAIISTELADNNNRKSLDRSMKILLDLASQHFSDDGQNFSKVLAMYILSALFKDTRIGEDVLRYAEQTLIIAIGSFDSVYWNVRNGASLLFCSLINRVFGTNRSKEEISKKNSMPGKMFFSKFPKLYQFFMQVITDSIKQLDTTQCKALLGRAHPGPSLHAQRCCQCTWNTPAQLYTSSAQVVLDALLIERKPLEILTGEE